MSLLWLNYHLIFVKNSLTVFTDMTFKSAKYTISRYRERHFSTDLGVRAAVRGVAAAGGARGPGARGRPRAAPPAPRLPAGRLSGAARGARRETRAARADQA